MAVVVTKSASISGRDSVPSVLGNSAITRANLKRALGIVGIVSGDSVGSTYLFESVPSNALVSSLLLSAPDIGTTTAMDIGLWHTTADGGAVVDQDFFTAAQALNAGPYAKVQCAFGNVLTVANMEKRLWEALGLSSDPRVMYDIVGTLTGAADGSGSVCLESYYAE